ncbi:MAG: flagellar motor switch protein FliN [Planctomycetes bacterium]|nr:flagellar motor switch protein FliN [Planctomycetota bacterium]
MAEILRRVSGGGEGEPVVVRNPEPAPARGTGGASRREAAPPPPEEPEERLEDHLELLFGVSLTLRIELGRTRMTIEEVLRLGRGSVVSLDRFAGDPVNIFVNDRLIARGEVVVSAGNFAVRVAEILLPKER